jgi:hypothetical protein
MANPVTILAKMFSVLAIFLLIVNALEEISLDQLWYGYSF